MRVNRIAVLMTLFRCARARANTRLTARSCDEVYDGKYFLLNKVLKILDVYLTEAPTLIHTYTHSLFCNNLYMTQRMDIKLNSKKEY